MKKTALLAITLLSLVSCTENQRARGFGGTMNVKIEKHEKFINVTWKNDDLWVITQDTITGIFYCRENSSFGVLEGCVIIKNKENINY